MALSRLAPLAPLALVALLPRPSAAQEGPWDAALHLLPPSRVAEFNARCLDGSQPGYYIRKASSPSTKWKIRGSRTRHPARKFRRARPQRQTHPAFDMAPAHLANHFRCARRRLVHVAGGLRRPRQ
jgi:hypothetical protein